MTEFEVQKYLQEHEVFGEVFSINEDNICVEIEWGDWKHEHGYCDYLMSEIGYTKSGEDVTETDGSDCYSSIHYYNK